MLTAETVSRRLLLDTHVWLWAVEGAAGKLSPGCLAALRSANQAGDVWVSVMSVWEIATLESLGRIVLSRQCDEWIRDELAAPSMNLAGLTPDIAIESTRLPGGFHRDPADRILVATARHLDATLVTSDREILAYGGQGHVRVMDAGS